MKLEKYKNTKIKYVKANGDTSIRSIIPMFTPSNIFTLDVTNMDDKTKTLLITRLAEHDRFVADVKKEMLDTEQWKETLQLLENLISKKESVNLIDKILQKEIASFEKWMNMYHPTELNDELKWCSLIPHNIYKPE